jgi:peptide/nickel transport system substrate-binding protein
VFVVLVAGGAAWFIRTRSAPDSAQTARSEAARGGRLIATYRTEPAFHNRLVATGSADELLARLTQAPLVRVNRQTGEVQPRLAESWTSSPDGLTWTFQLRKGVKFSDGTPFTAADVVFTFRALYDPGVASSIASTVQVRGQPLQVRALDESSIVVVFPAPYGPGISVLDAVPILPRHRLEAALDAGRFAETWKMNTPVAELAGLGPFKVREYVPAQRMVLDRNPHYWMTGADGQALPYLDELEIQFVPDQNAEVLRLQAGEVDLTTSQVRFEDLASLQKLSRSGAIRLHDAGVTTAPDVMWFNLNPDAPAAARPWLQSTSLRRAVSMAIDRTALVNTVYLGEAVPIAGPVTPGHGKWYDASVAVPVFDRARAIAELEMTGLRDRDGDGVREDASGKPARFSLLTQQGHSVRERTAYVVQEQLKQIGLAVDVVALDTESMIDRFGKKDYDAILFGFEFDSFDPARHVDFWMSRGRFHVWRPRQATPATSWEARIDDLMARQSTTLDDAERRRLFNEARKVLAEEQPALYFAASRVILATSARVQGVQPSVLSPNILWNAEGLSIAGARR